MAKFSKFLFFSAVFLSVFTSAQTQPAFRSPKKMAIHWLNNSPDSEINFSDRLDLSQFLFPKALCNDSKSENLNTVAYVLNQNYKLTLDANNFRSTGSFRSICEGKNCFYFHQVEYVDQPSCENGSITNETIKRFRMTFQIDENVGYYPPVGDYGFHMEWSPVETQVKIYEIKFHGSYGNYEKALKGLGDITEFF